MVAEAHGKSVNRLSFGRRALGSFEVSPGCRAQGKSVCSESTFFLCAASKRLGIVLRVRFGIKTLQLNAESRKKCPPLLGGLGNDHYRILFERAAL